MSNSEFPRLRYSDVYEQQVLDASLVPFSAFAVPAGIPTAEVTAACQTSSVNIQGCKQLDIFVDVATNPGNASTKLYIKVRFSGKQFPDPAVNTDWGYIQIDNIDAATGISSVQDYVIEIDLLNANGAASGAPRRYVSRIQQISGRHASAVVWVDAGTATGTVSFMRQGGSM